MLFLSATWDTRAGSGQWSRDISSCCDPGVKAWRRGLTSLLSFQASGSLPPCQPWPASLAGPSESRQAPSPLWRREGFVFLRKISWLPLLTVCVWNFNLSFGRFLGRRDLAKKNWTYWIHTRQHWQKHPRNYPHQIKIFQTFMTCVFLGWVTKYKPTKTSQGPPWICIKFPPPKWVFHWMTMGPIGSMALVYYLPTCTFKINQIVGKLTIAKLDFTKLSRQLSEPSMAACKRCCATAWIEGFWERMIKLHTGKLRISQNIPPESMFLYTPSDSHMRYSRSIYHP